MLMHRSGVLLTGYGQTRYNPDWKLPWKTRKTILESDPWRLDSSRSLHVSVAADDSEGF